MHFNNYHEYFYPAKKEKIHPYFKNHFMLKVNDIATIGDKLIEEGYELENNNYAKDLYTFFIGPNGEIIGLSAWED